MQAILKLKNAVLLFFFVSIIVLLVYKKFITKESLTLPIEFYNYRYYMYLFIVFFALLLALMTVFLHDINKHKKFINFLENIKGNFDFIPIFLNENWINIDKIYKYFGFNKKRLFQYYLLSNWSVRSFVLIIFMFDVFYFRHLFYFYKILPLLLIPLAFRIFYYFLRRHIDINCQILKDKIQPIVFYPETGILGVIALKEYIHIASLKLLNVQGKVSRGTIALDPNYISSGTSLEIEQTLAKFKKIVERMILNYIVIYRFENQKAFYDNKVNIIIRLGYFIGWVYIFYLSDTLNFILLLTFLAKIYLKFEEPFSGLSI